MSKPIQYMYQICWYEHTLSNTAFRKKGPCIVYNDGTVFFSQLSTKSYSRNNGPGVIHSSGQIRFTKSGKLHRTDGPAVIQADGNKEYWVKGKLLPAAAFFLKYGVL